MEWVLVMVKGKWLVMVVWSVRVWSSIGCTTREGSTSEWKGERDQFSSNRSSQSVWIRIWLILPVVIRSSQRLSHACVSVNVLVWNCEWLIISVIVYLVKCTTWITVVILGLIHEKVLWWGVFIRMKTICFGSIVSNSNLSYRMLNVAMSLSSFCPISFRW